MINTTIILTDITIINVKTNAYDKIANNHGEQKERDAAESGAVDTVPHGLDPLAAEHPEDDHERVKEVAEMPSQLASVKVLRDVVGAEQLHAHHGENEDDYCQHETEVAERSHRASNDTDQ